ncbi:MAG TPA: D-2-hydroxyacid dehydrogenase [Pyrinomonadaceae bacterium]|jgi:phosphoglycerate dehydrogenase-like enzyme|nr:D-2-hydroxyacid dehydrogenase [Pyrinomonadaceae bacterium]
MTKSVLTIWCNNDFSTGQEPERELLTKGVGGHRLLFFEPDDDGRGGASRDALRDADIAFGSPEARAASDCERLLWIQLNTAGYTSFDHADIKQKLTARGTRLTNSSAVYDEPCAQHLLAMMLSLARGLPFALDAQRGDRAWHMHGMRPGLRLLNGQTVLMLGYGAIARRLVELLRPLGMNLVAVRRRVNGDEQVRVFETDAVDELLPLADHIVNILPANEQTNNYLNDARLASLKRGAIVYNIGRGTTLDQNALTRELRDGRIAAAYLDVTDPEPLPPEHPLWETPNCFITPHVGGGREDEKERQVHHFLDNLRRFERGEGLHDRFL